MNNRVGRPITEATKRIQKTQSDAVFEWSLKACSLLKQAMKARGWGYQELEEALKPLGYKQSATDINRRINRGSFSAGYLLACLTVLGFDGSLSGAKRRSAKPRQAAQKKAE